jgi:hypothetical protein
VSAFAATVPGNPNCTCCPSVQGIESSRVIPRRAGTKVVVPIPETLCIVAPEDGEDLWILGLRRCHMKAMITAATTRAAIAPMMALATVLTCDAVRFGGVVVVVFTLNFMSRTGILRIVG